MTAGLWGDPAGNPTMALLWLLILRCLLHPPANLKAWERFRMFNVVVQIT